MICVLGFYQRADCHRGVLCTASSEEAHTGLHCVRGTGVLFCMCLYHVLYVLVPRLHGPLVHLCLQCNPNPMPLLSTFHDKPHSFMAQDTNQRLMLPPPRLSLSLDRARCSRSPHILATVAFGFNKHWHCLQWPFCAPVICFRIIDILARSPIFFHALARQFFFF